MTTLCPFLPAVESHLIPNYHIDLFKIKIYALHSFFIMPVSECLRHMFQLSADFTPHSSNTFREKQLFKMPHCPHQCSNI